MRYYISFLLLMAGTTLPSCNDEEPSFNMIFTNSANLQDVSRYYLFLSDHEGNLLEYIPLRNQSVANFARPKVLLNDYQLTIAKVVYSNVHIDTYMNVPPGSYYIRIGDGQDNLPASIGKFLINVPDRNSYNMFNVDSEKMTSFGILENHTKYEVNLSSPSSDLFICLATNNFPVPRYYYNAQVQVGGSLTLTDDLINQLNDMEIELVDLTDEESPEAYALIYGNTSNHSSMVSVSGLATDYKLPLYYAPISLYKDFTTEMSYKSKIGLRDVTHRLVRKSIVPLITKDPVEVTLGLVKNNSITNLEYNSNGTSDYHLAYFTGYQGNVGVQWRVYSPSSETTNLKIAEFPDRFLDEANIQFLKSMKFSDISFHDDLETETYNDFLVRELRKVFKNSPYHTVPPLTRSVTFHITE